MPSITPQLIEAFPFSQYADPQSIQRGRAYYKDGRVWEVSLFENNSRAVCEVNGDLGEYTVEISADKTSGELTFDCDCPYADDGNFCKHMVASALELKDYLNEEIDDFDEDEDLVLALPQASLNWQKKLGETLAIMPRKMPSPNLRRYVALVILERSRMGIYGYGSAYRGNYSYFLTPFIIKETNGTVSRTARKNPRRKSIIF